MANRKRETGDGRREFISPFTFHISLKKANPQYINKGYNIAQSVNISGLKYVNIYITVNEEKLCQLL